MAVIACLGPAPWGGGLGGGSGGSGGAGLGGDGLPEKHKQPYSHDRRWRKYAYATKCDTQHMECQYKRVHV